MAKSFISERMKNKRRVRMRLMISSVADASAMACVAMEEDREGHIKHAWVSMKKVVKILRSQSIFVQTRCFSKMTGITL